MKKELDQSEPKEIRKRETPAIYHFLARDDPQEPNSPPPLEEDLPPIIEDMPSDPLNDSTATEWYVSDNADRFSDVEEQEPETVPEIIHIRPDPNLVNFTKNKITKFSYKSVNLKSTTPTPCLINPVAGELEPIPSVDTTTPDKSTPPNPARKSTRKPKSPANVTVCYCENTLLSPLRKLKRLRKVEI